MKIFILKYLYIITTGSIFYLFSERYFWSFWRNGEDNLSGTLWGIVFYSTAAYAVLFLIDRYKVNSREGLVVVGLLFGFLIEGMMAGLLYTPLMPMIILVALPWHALVTVLFGWHYLPKIISEAKLNKKITLTLGLGLIWCLWAIGWFTLPNATEYQYSVSNFLIHGLITTACLVFVYLLNAWVRSSFDITFKTYEGYMILILFFTFLGLVHPGTIAVSFPLSIAVITSCILLLRKQKSNLDNNQTYSFPTTIKGTQWLLLCYIIASATMVIALSQDVYIETAYIFAIPLALTSLYYVGKSLRIFFKKAS